MLKKTYECFQVSIEDKIAHIVLNRPEAFNAMNRPFWNDLPEIIAEIDDQAKARVIVISSTGKHFSAGMDLAVFAQGGIEGQGRDRYIASEQFYRNIAAIQSSFTCLEAARVPVLMAIQGGCIGGAVDFASACDIRWCTEDAFFCIQEINIAMTADVGTFPRLQRLMPEGMVREMAYTGMRLGAAEALRLGLVNGVFADADALLAHVMGVAREIATKSPLAVTGSKRIINYGRDHSTADTLDYIGVWNASMLAPPHMGEAFASKQQKREGDFPDLAPIRRTPM
jgi:enoyl-CoA hydratase